MSISAEVPRPLVSDTLTVNLVYLLYLAGYFTGITAIIGIVLAYVKIGDAEPLERSHYQFQIRTFWIGLLYLTVGFALSIVLVGFAILFWWFIWSAVRIIKGGVAFNDGLPIANPKSWLFG